MKTKILLLVVTLITAWGFKRHYADAQPEELSWILTPTTQVVGVVTGVSFQWLAGEGYFSRERLFLVEKSCAGINFMIAAFGMLVFAQLHRGGDVRSVVRLFVVSLAASYVAAIVVNTVRIGLAVKLAERPAWLAPLSAPDVHRLEGVVVYFGGLVLLHELVRRSWVTR